MTLNKDDLKAIGEVFDTKLEEFVGSVRRGFDEQREYMNKQFAQIKDILVDHSLLLHRLDKRTHEQQRTLDDHEVRLKLLEKQ